MQNFKIGDTIKVTNKYRDENKSAGGCYSTYQKFFKENNLIEFENKFVFSRSLKNGIYKIVGFGKHYCDNQIIYVLESNNNQIYLMGNMHSEMNLVEDDNNSKQINVEKINKVYTYKTIPYKINWEITHNGEVTHETVDSKDFSLKTIINRNTTIVILNDGSKGIARCMPSDEYNIDKGIKIAYTKALIKSYQKKLKKLVK